MPQELMTVKNVEVSNIINSKFNARDPELEADNNPDFIELCQSIKTNGLIEPLVIRTTGNGHYETIAGSRRLKALKMLGIDKTTAIVRQISDNDVRIFSLVENIQRKNLEEDEKMECLAEIYKASKDSWVPKFPTYAENKIIDKHGYSELAQTYLKRMHNEDTKEGYEKLFRKANDLETPKSSEKAQFSNAYIPQVNRGIKQEIYPTDEFRSLAYRIGYAYSTQYNIIRGAGTFKTEKQYFEELPKDVQTIINEEIKKAIEADKALKEHEKLQKEKEMKQKAAFKYQVRTKTKKTESLKAQRGRQQAQETKQKKKPTKAQQAKSVVEDVIEKEKEHSKAHKKSDLESGWTVNEQVTKKAAEQPNPKISPVRAREQIISLCDKLFELLSGDKLNMGDLAASETIAKSKAAKINMEEIAAFYAYASDRAAQQYAVIPTAVLLSHYRDILYEAVERAKKNENIMRE